MLCYCLGATCDSAVRVSRSISRTEPANNRPFELRPHVLRSCAAVRYSAHLTLTDCLSKTRADAIPRREEGKGDSATLASLLHRDRQGHMLRTFSKRLPVRRLQELSAMSPVDCPICDGASKLDAPHPEVDLLRCSVRGHRFSRIKDGSSWERYDPLYYQETHRNWFAHPDLGLFDTIARRREIASGRRVLAACSRGDQLLWMVNGQILSSNRFLPLRSRNIATSFWTRIGSCRNAPLT